MHVYVLCRGIAQCLERWAGNPEKLVMTNSPCGYELLTWIIAKKQASLWGRAFILTRLWCSMLNFEFKQVSNPAIPQATDTSSTISVYPIQRDLFKFPKLRLESCHPLCGIRFTEWKFSLLFFWELYVIKRVNEWLHRKTSHVYHSSQTLLSPPEIARMLPVSDQLACQTTSLNFCNSLDTQLSVVPSHVQITTRPSCGKTRAAVIKEPISQFIHLENWVGIGQLHIY